MTPDKAGINTWRESSLHAALKQWYAEPGDELEVAMEGFLVDLRRDDLLVEVQTSGFGALKQKVARLSEQHAVRLVHPIPQERWIVRVDARGRPQSRRKSPKRGRVEDVFAELVSLPQLLMSPRCSLEVLLIREEQVWADDGRGSWRRQRWSLADRRLLEVVHRHLLTTPADCRALLPPGLPQPFTTLDLALASGMPRALAQQMSFCLRTMGAIALVGKRGRALLYQCPHPAVPAPRTRGRNKSLSPDLHASVRRGHATDSP